VRPREAAPAKSEAEEPIKYPGGSVIAEPWEHILPPHISQVLLGVWFRSNTKPPNWGMFGVHVYVGSDINMYPEQIPC